MVGDAGFGADYAGFCVFGGFGGSCRLVRYSFLGFWVGLGFGGLVGACFWVFLVFWLPTVLVVCDSVGWWRWCVWLLQ